MIRAMQCALFFSLKGTNTGAYTETYMKQIEIRNEARDEQRLHDFQITAPECNKENVQNKTQHALINGRSN